MARGGEKYKENPFVKEMVLKRRDKEVRLSLLGKDNNVLLNTNTGEILGTHVVTKKKVDTAQFVKLFTENIRLAFDLKSPGIKAFSILVWALQKKVEIDQVHLDPVAMNEFLEQNPGAKISFPTFWRGIKELEDAKIIARTLRLGTYWVNPAFCFNGDRIAFTTVLERVEHQREEHRQGAIPFSDREECDAQLPPPEEEI